MDFHSNSYLKIVVLIRFTCSIRVLCVTPVRFGATMYNIQHKQVLYSEHWEYPNLLTPFIRFPVNPENSIHC